MRRALGDAGGAVSGPVEVFVARGRNVLLLLVACAFVAAGVFLLIQGDPDARWIAIACILFFGACAVVFVRMIVDARPRLVFDDVGVFDRTLGVGRIPWDDILAANWASLNGNHFICLVLRDEAHWLAKLSPLQRRLASANRGLGFGSINLNLSGLAVDPAVAFSLVQAEIAGRMPDASGDDAEADAAQSDVEGEAADEEAADEEAADARIAEHGQAIVRVDDQGEANGRDAGDADGSGARHD